MKPRDELIEKMAIYKHEAFRMTIDQEDRPLVFDLLSEEEKKELRELERQSLSAIEAAGCTIVPNEATPLLIAHGYNAAKKPRPKVNNVNTDLCVTIGVSYYAMLAASPYRSVK